MARLLLQHTYEQKQKGLPQATGHGVRRTWVSKRLRRSLLRSTGRTKTEESTSEDEKAQSSNHVTVFHASPGRAGKALRHGNEGGKRALSDHTSGEGTSYELLVFSMATISSIVDQSFARNCFLSSLSSAHWTFSSVYRSVASRAIASAPTISPRRFLSTAKLKST